MSKLRELESRVEAIEAWIEEFEAEAEKMLEEMEGMEVVFTPAEDLVRDRKKDH